MLKKKCLLSLRSFDDLVRNYQKALPDFIWPSAVDLVNSVEQLLYILNRQPGEVGSFVSWELVGETLFPASPLTSSVTLASALSPLGFFGSLVYYTALPFIHPSAHVKTLYNLNNLACIGEFFFLAFIDLSILFFRESRI